MINEKEILRQEEVDFRGVINRFKRGWPVVALFLGFWLFIGIVFLLTFPPIYTAKTTVLIEKPKGSYDPNTMVSSMSTFVKQPDDYYYNNQKVVMRSFPIMSKAVKDIGSIAYYNDGLFNKELYRNTPFTVELDSTFMGFTRHETPYGEFFEVSFDDFEGYKIEVEGEYPVTKNEYGFEGNFKFGEWVTFDQTKFKIELVDSVKTLQGEQLEDLISDDYGFVIMNPITQTIEYISSMEIEQEELESTAFGVSLGGTSPQKQVDFLHHLGEHYIEDHIALKTQMLKLAIGYLEEELADIGSKLEQSEDDIELFKTENAITSINREGSLLLEQSVKLQNNKVNILVQGKYYDYLEEYLRTNTEFSQLISPQAFGVKDQLIIRLTEELVQMEQEKNYYEEIGAQSNPAYDQLVSSINSNRQTILNSIKGFNESNKVLEQDIDNRIKELDDSAKELPKAQRKLMELERFFRMNESFYTTLMERKSDTEITLISTTPNVRIIEPAYITTTEPIFPTVPIILLAAILLGILSSFGVLVTKWVFNNSVDNSREIYRYIPQARILGELFHTNIKKASTFREYPNSTLASQLATLLFRLRKRNPDSKLISISSYRNGEGKTFTASFLAMQSAKEGNKTLLVDANLKDPKAKEFIRVSQSPSLIDVHLKNADLSDVIASSGSPLLDIVEVGKTDQFTKTQMDSLLSFLSSCREKYDLIFIDTAPVSLSPVPLELINMADEGVMVVRRSKTRYQDLEDLYNLIAQESLDIENFIVTDTFDPHVSLSLIPRKSPYKKDKNWGLIGRLKYTIARI